MKRARRLLVAVVVVGAVLVAVGAVALTAWRPTASSSWPRPSTRPGGAP